MISVIYIFVLYRVSPESLTSGGILVCPTTLGGIFSHPVVLPFSFLSNHLGPQSYHAVVSASLLRSDNPIIFKRPSTSAYFVTDVATPSQHAESCGIERRLRQTTMTYSNNYRPESTLCRYRSSVISAQVLDKPGTYP